MRSQTSPASPASAEDKIADPLYGLFIAKRDRQLWGAPVAEEAHADAVAAWFRARDKEWKWSSSEESAICWHLKDLSKDEAKILKKGLNSGPPIEIARKLAVLGEILPIKRGEETSYLVGPAEVERRMVGAFRRQNEHETFIAPISVANGTRQISESVHSALADRGRSNGPTVGAWPVYNDVDPDDLDVIQEGLMAAPELMLVAGVLAELSWGREPPQVANQDQIDNQAVAWLVQWEHDPDVEAARRIILRCLREGLKQCLIGGPNKGAYLKARRVYYPAVAKRLGVKLIRPKMVKRPAEYLSDTIVGLDAIAAQAGVVKTATILRSFVQGKTSLAYRGGRFVAPRSFIRTRPEREQKRAAST